MGIVYLKIVASLCFKCKGLGVYQLDHFMILVDLCLFN